MWEQIARGCAVSIRGSFQDKHTTSFELSTAWLDHIGALQVSRGVYSSSAVGEPSPYSKGADVHLSAAKPSPSFQKTFGVDNIWDLWE